MPVEWLRSNEPSATCSGTTREAEERAARDVSGYAMALSMRSTTCARAKTDVPETYATSGWGGRPFSSAVPLIARDHGALLYGLPTIPMPASGGACAKYRRAHGVFK